MKNALLVDLHTHNKIMGDHIQVVSLFLGDNVPTDGPYSVGIHPYHSNTSEQELEACFKPYLDSMAAIGEIGLDRTIKIPIEQQSAILKAQLGIAAKHGFPVIIHCVRAYSDILHHIKAYPELCYIFHAFAGNIDLIKQLLRYNCYFSAGERELSRPQAESIIGNIPIDRLFLETDDQPANIAEVYRHASMLLKLDLSTLKTQLYINYKRIFK